MIDFISFNRREFCSIKHLWWYEKQFWNTTMQQRESISITESIWTTKDVWVVINWSCLGYIGYMGLRFIELYVFLLLEDEYTKQNTTDWRPNTSLSSVFSVCIVTGMWVIWFVWHHTDSRVTTNGFVLIWCQDICNRNDDISSSLHSESTAT